jgi:hypothetical protein
MLLFHQLWRKQLAAASTNACTAACMAAKVMSQRFGLCTASSAGCQPVTPEAYRIITGGQHSAVRFVSPCQPPRPGSWQVTACHHLENRYSSAYSRGSP